MFRSFILSSMLATSTLVFAEEEPKVIKPSSFWAPLQAAEQIIKRVRVKEQLAKPTFMVATLESTVDDSSDQEEEKDSNEDVIIEEDDENNE